MFSLAHLSIAASLVAIVVAQGGGMAELKAITGDAPYSGVGNVPAPIPQPMGFWGRPRYSPGGFGSSPYWGGSPYYDGGYGPDRFTSVGHSPYGAAGPLPYRPYQPDLYSAMMSFLDGASSPFSSRPSSIRRVASPTVSPPVPSLTASPVPSPVPSTGSDHFSMSSLGGGGGLGGFYKGNGN